VIDISSIRTPGQSEGREKKLRRNGRSGKLGAAMKLLQSPLLFLLLLAGCSRPVPPVAAPEQTPTPPAEATATPVPPVAVATATPIPPAAEVSYVGTWTATDEDGEPFDLIVFPNGQAVSNWTKGPAGARGERGFWRREGDHVLLFFQDGWTDQISPSEDGFEHRGFAPETDLSGPPKNSSAAKRLEKGGFIGVWCLNKEPDDSFQNVALQSSGRAVSTIGGGTEGTWKETPKGALCTWPEGWRDLISPVEGGYQKRSWVGEEEQDGSPPDIAPALRVGEANFVIMP
jgi:hypothetical protein